MPTKLLLTVAGFHLLVICVPIAILMSLLTPRLHKVMFALFLGLLVGFLNLQGDDVQFPVLLLLAFAFFLAYQEPKLPWHLVPILGAWVPAGELIRHALASSEPPHDVVGPFVAFVPALIGTIVGYAAGKVFERTRINAAGAHAGPADKPFDDQKDPLL